MPAPMEQNPEFQPRYWNPCEQDVDEAMWCVRTNPPYTCGHEPECRDVFYAEILRLRAEIVDLQDRVNEANEAADRARD